MLVADDNAENRALACATLEDEGLHPVIAKDGEEALALVTADPPDCILLDIRMPKLDGIGACERIRQLPGGEDIAIIFVTAQREVQVFDRALAAGGDDFMTKPFRPAELVVRIQTAMRLRKIARERGELYEQLKHQRDALQRLELQKEQLVAFLVHDLKNPVNSIDLNAQSLQNAATQPERVLRVAAKIRDDSRNLLRMITNLLDISKADEGRLAPNRKDIDLGALVGRVLEELGPTAAHASVALTADVGSLRTSADPDLLARVLANLIENALRHSPEGTQVTVSAAEVEGAVEMRVSDRGPGVPVEQRGSVFERFVGGERNATRTNRGLGLAFCKLAVEAHGGRIWIEDNAPGAVFCIRLG
ncbi:MAG: response regulator [Deltaproteobacteria bacterium]|nr:response regulator [Deltaproteobacteria bacterium]